MDRNGKCGHFYHFSLATSRYDKLIKLKPSSIFWKDYRKPALNKISSHKRSYSVCLWSLWLRVCPKHSVAQYLRNWIRYLFSPSPSLAQSIPPRLIRYLGWLDQPSRRLSRSLIVIGLAICAGTTAGDYAELHLGKSHTRLRKITMFFHQSDIYCFVVSIILICFGGLLEGRKSGLETLTTWFPLLMVIGVWICRRLMISTRREAMEFKSRLEERKSI